MGKWAKISVLGVSIWLLAMPFLGKEATAGLKSSVPVGVNLSAGHAWGAMGAARNTSNNVEYIGCGVETSWSSGLFNLAPLVTCSGRSAGGTSFMCTSIDPKILAAVRGLTGDANLDLEWDSSGECVSIGVSIYSDNAAKNP